HDVDETELGGRDRAREHDERDRLQQAPERPGGEDAEELPAHAARARRGVRGGHAANVAPGSPRDVACTLTPWATPRRSWHPARCARRSPTGRSRSPS